MFSVQTRLQPVIETPQDSESARKSLLEQVEHWLRSGQAPDSGRLVRLEVPFQGEDALRWLAAQVITYSYAGEEVLMRRGKPAPLIKPALTRVNDYFASIIE